MSTLQEIESAIEHLPAKDQWELFQHLHDRLEKKWDQQIESDYAAGRLDSVIAEARADIAARRVRPLDEFLDHS